MHGKGDMTLSDSTKYQGDWEDDKRHGYGEVEFGDGTKYQG
jgi:hypothetical protein